MDQGRRTGPGRWLAEAETALGSGEAERALGLVDRALAEGGTNGDALKLRARAYEAMGDLPRALEVWSEARDVMPRSGSVRVNRGKVLFRLGQYDEALAEHETAVALDPLQMEGWKGILALRPVDPRETGLDRVARSIDDPGRSGRLRAKAGFVMGQILLEAGQHDSAFDHYARANAIVAEEAGEKGLEYRYPAGSFDIDRALIDRYASAVPHVPACPAILIAGLPRSGKSLAESLIVRDPTVRAGDELAVLARQARLYDWSHGADAVVQGLSRMDVSPLAPPYIAQLQGHRRVTDTSPTNLFRLGLIGLLHPQVPVILCRRDPLDLGASMFFKQFRQGNLFTASLPVLGRALARAERMMAHWQRVLPNPLSEISYEAMVADPDGAAHSLGSLCGTRPAAVPAGPVGMRLTPGRSLGFDAVDKGLVGFAQPLKARFAPMLSAYEAERDRLVSVGR